MNEGGPAGGLQALHAGPRLVVFSGLFPSAVQPGAGLFVRERAFRVGQRIPITVVSPTPWFPLQALLRRFKPGFRPGAPAVEQQAGNTVWFARYLSVPGVLKRFDGVLMALGAWWRLRALHRQHGIGAIDAHFAYPDGYAATLLARWLNVPATITLRGTEVRHAKDPVLAPLVRAALQRATRVFAVSDSLRQVAIGLGIEPAKVRVVGNGVDIQRFWRIDPVAARAELGIAADAKVLVTVGGLVERKGFHRVIELLPQLREKFPGLVYLVVGGASVEGDMTAQLKAQVSALGLQNQVRFLGAMAPERLHRVLSGADVFVLATRNEGWANVLLEAMACGLPVVATDVGGNAEVICRDDLGTIVPFGDADALRKALAGALNRLWDPATIRAYAEANTWNGRIDVLESEFKALMRQPASDPSPPEAQPRARP